MLAALPRWMAIPMDWKRKLVDILSPLASAILDPISFINFKPLGAQGPSVSLATGMVIYPEVARSA